MTTDVSMLTNQAGNSSLKHSTESLASCMNAELLALYSITVLCSLEFPATAFLGACEGAKSRVYSGGALPGLPNLYTRVVQFIHASVTPPFG